MEKRIVLSKRLRAVAGLVPAGVILADVGTDHGYVPICLVQGGVCPKAYAMDVRKGPLSRAGEHIRSYGLEDYIETRLSDGLGALKAGEAEAVVIAGMGGALMQRILTEGHDISHAAKALVLQPQSEVGAFRRFLIGDGYVILDEEMVREDGKFYPILRAAPAEHGTDAVNRCFLPADGTKPGGYEDRELQYGPHLLNKRHPVLKQYLTWRENQLEAITEDVGRHGDGITCRHRLVELEQERGMLRSVLIDYYED